MRFLIFLRLDFPFYRLNGFVHNFQTAKETLEGARDEEWSTNEVRGSKSAYLLTISFIKVPPRLKQLFDLQGQTNT